jgi:hypothetical protein
MGHLQIQVEVSNLLFLLPQLDMRCPVYINSIVKTHACNLPKGNSRAKYALNHVIIRIFVFLKAI